MGEATEAQIMAIAEEALAMPPDEEGLIVSEVQGCLPESSSLGLVFDQCVYTNAATGESFVGSYHKNF
jgi:hypothetical protein